MAGIYLERILGDADKGFYKNEIFLYLHGRHVYRSAFAVGDFCAAWRGIVQKKT